MDIRILKKILKKSIKAVTPYIIVKKYQDIKNQDIKNQDIRDRETNNCVKYNKIKQINDKNYIHNIIIDSFLKTSKYGEKYFDFNGCLLPDIRNIDTLLNTFPFVLSETFYFYLFFNDNYEKDRLKLVDCCMGEGPYCYTDIKNNIDITIKENDIVIDAGAWIGDFSAYAANKGAVVYAFEPTKTTYDYLEKTAQLNSGNIIPIKCGLSNSQQLKYITHHEVYSGANRVIEQEEGDCEQIHVTTIDEFVEKNQLSKVDFIKADIEGQERYMLMGAKETLRKFAPKLALCTYHLPDDPEILSQLILDANPNYTIVQIRKKLFACVK